MTTGPRVLARVAWRLSRSVLHLLWGLAIVQLRFPSIDAAGRERHIGRWSAGLLRCMGVALQVEGVAPRRGATLLVSNHVSWLDIAALHAVLPQARFVSKADVHRWPLVGSLVAGAGTLFIERGRTRDALRVVHAMAEALAAGHTVAVFPEGTVGPGRPPLPFHANLLQAAIATGSPVQPAVLRYATPGEAFAGAVDFVGNTTLMQSFWRIAAATGLRVHVRLLSPETSAHADRRALAARLRALVAAELNVQAEDAGAGGAAAAPPATTTPATTATPAPRTAPITEQEPP